VERGGLPIIILYPGPFVRAEMVGEAASWSPPSAMQLDTQEPAQLTQLPAELQQQQFLRPPALGRARSSPGQLSLSTRALPASPSGLVAGLEHRPALLQAGGGVLQQEDLKGLYEVKTGMIQVYGRPSKFAPGEGALRAGTRFFGTPFRAGRARWLLLQVDPTDDRALFSAEAKSRAPQAKSFFASDDVARNLYSRAAPLPMAPPGRTWGEAEDPLWVLEDEQYLRRLRVVHRPTGDVASRRVQSLETDDAIRLSAGVVAGGGPLRLAHRETKCPKRQRGPLSHWSHSALAPKRLGASTRGDFCHATSRGNYCHVNFKRHSTVDPRLSLH